MKKCNNFVFYFHKKAIKFPISNKLIVWYFRYTHDHDKSAKRYLIVYFVKKKIIKAIPM